jgi:prepilin-type N-terminal cleavage/methylation domain-containing protein
MTRPGRPRGFTIIEVVATLAVASILAALSIPFYVGYLKKTRATEALVALSSIRNAQRAYRENEELGGGISYAPDLVSLHWSVSGDQLGGKYYNYATDEFSAVAVARPGMTAKVASNTIKLVFAKDAPGSTDRIVYRD